MSFKKRNIESYDFVSALTSFESFAIKARFENEPRYERAEPPGKAKSNLLSYRDLLEY